MKRLVLIASLVGFSTALAIAQQPSDDEIKKAYFTCKEHRVIHWDQMHPKFVPPADFRIKTWAPGWESCSGIQDAYEVIEQREAATKDAGTRSAVDNLAGKLKK